MCIIHQLYPRNPKLTSFITSGNASRTDAPHRFQQRNCPQTKSTQTSSIPQHHGAHMHFCFSILETFLYSYTRLRDPLSRDTRSFPFPFDSYKIYIVLPFLRKACCHFRIKSFKYCVIQGASYDFF